MKTLSGGTKRKLSVCLSFISNPKVHLFYSFKGIWKVVFLDEPTTGMDPIMRRKVWEIIKENKLGRAIILTTHSMEEADAICDRIGIYFLIREGICSLSIPLRLANRRICSAAVIVS